VDLNGDGQLDMISGSWPGELFLFRGGPDRSFAAPEMLKDKNDEYINIGGGITEQPDGSIYITGHAEFEKTPEGTFAVYHGKRIESTTDKPISITGTASAVHAVDWDVDGDFDLLVGDIGGSVYLIPNEGTATSYSFGKEEQIRAGNKPLRVNGDAGPFIADWDADGDIDLLVGDGSGGVSLFRNTGKSKTPILAAAEQLVAPGSTIYGNDAPAEPQRGVRSKVCAADWNGDGLLDLLVGDFATQKPDLPELTAEEKVEHAKLRKELESVQKRFSELISKLYGPSRVKDKAESEKLQEEMKTVSQEMQDLRGKLPPEYETHGWVWLFIRKSSEKRNDT